MKHKKSKLFRTLFLLSIILKGFTPGFAQQQSYNDYSRWSVGVNAGIPFFVGDMTSFSSNKLYVGYLFGLQADYRFSPLWGLSLTTDFGENKVGTYNYARNFMLDDKGNACCCPPPMGTAAYYEDLYGVVRFFSAGLHAEFNLNYLFAPNKETQWTVLLSPALYLQKYFPKIYTIATDKQFTDGSLSNPLSIGLGGDVALRYRLNPALDLQVRSGLIWITDEHFEGINNNSKSYANFSWNTSVGIVFKLNGKNKKDNIMYARTSMVAEQPQPTVWIPVQLPVDVKPVKEEEPLDFNTISAEDVPVSVTPQTIPQEPRVYEALPEIYFQRGHTVLNAKKYAQELAAIVAAAHQNPTTTLVISAYCDHTGTLKENEKIAEQRAESMSNYLLKQGIDPERISVGYLGIDTQLTGEAAYSEKARRVEVVLKDKK